MLETRTGGAKALDVIKKLGFSDYATVDAAGFSSGICFFGKPLPYQLPA